MFNINFAFIYRFTRFPLVSLGSKNVCDCSLVYFLFLGPYSSTIYFFIKITIHKHNTTVIGEITKNKTHSDQLFPLNKKPIPFVIFHN